MTSPPSTWLVRFAARVRPGGTVLDLAAGSGRHTRALRDLGYRVTAVDIDLPKLEDLRADPCVELVEADLEAGVWPFQGRRFDGIVVTNYLHRPLLPRLSDSLARGGVLIYETFGVGHEAYGRPRNPAYLLREGELLDVYQHRLDVIAFEHVHEREPRPAVIQRICAVLPEDPSETPKRHPDARGSAETE